MEAVAPDYGETGWLRPSARLLNLRQLEVAGAAAVGLVGGLLGARGQLLGIVLTLAGLAVLTLLGLLYVRRRFRSWGYLERDEDLLVRRGVMYQRLSVVPFGRMQTVEVTAGPLERAFRLATVQLHTASASTDARIPGLEAWVAAQLRDRLVRLGEATAEGL